MGNKIKERREELGMSQYDLARESGVSRVTIWSLETNPHHTTTTKTLAKIAKALHTTIGDIFFADGVQQLNTCANQTDVNPVED